MKRFYFTFLLLLAPLLSIASEVKFGETPKFAEAVAAYDEGDFEKAKNLFLSIPEYKMAEEKVYANLLLSNIAAAIGDLELAKTCFPQAFENVPEKNRYPLAFIFARFCDANSLFDFSVKYLEPFFKKYPELLYKNSVMCFWYARALSMLSRNSDSQEILATMWDKFSTSETEEGIDKILFDENLKKLLREYVANAETKSELQSLRKKIILDEKELGEIPETLSLGLIYWLVCNTDKIPLEAMESAVESNNNSAFAWQILHYLAKKYFDEQDYSLAFAFASRADTLSPAAIEDTWKLKIFMGDCLRYLKRPQEAVPYYSSVSKNPICQGNAAAEAIFKVGLCYFEEKKWGNACYFFQYVVVAYPSFEYWTARAYYYGALAQVNMGNNIIAKNFLREYLRKAKAKDTEIYKDICALWTQIPLN